MATNGTTIFMDPATLTPQQRVDLHILTAANDAVCSALEEDSIWRLPTPPLYCCILIALAVQDTLHAWGRPDAKLVRSGLDVRRLTGSLPRNVLTIGSPLSPRIEGMWPAHAILQMGDILQDPTHGQTKRPWNHSPRSAAFLIEPLEGQEIDVAPGVEARALVMQRYWHGGDQYQVTYFKLPRTVDLATRKWRLAPDARPERRAAIVEAAVRRKPANDFVAAAGPAQPELETIIKPGFAIRANRRRNGREDRRSLNA